MVTKEKSKTAKNYRDELKADVGLRVDYDQYYDVTREHDLDDKRSSEDTASTWSINGLALVDKYPDVTACFPVKPGDTVYFVYAVYSTGDSFGHSENGSSSWIDVYKTFSKAEKAAQTIRDHYDWQKRLNSRWEPLTKEQRKKLRKKYKNEFTVDIVRENGKKMGVHAGWNGYFESLSYVEVQSITVDANKRERY